MNKLILLLIAGFCLTLSSCKKGPGEGGTSSIKGKVWVTDYNGEFTSVKGEYWGEDEKVYIIYGDDISYSDRISTGPGGEFEFKFLRPGKYTIYVYSKDKEGVVGPPANPNAPDEAIEVEVEIKKKKEEVDAGTISIFN
ncbi:MAG: hypothetical protein M3R27_02465 [Bacteroidota bacterium]|nr:hypothetical protein [Bacteroidota bacterium]